MSFFSTKGLIMIKTLNKAMEIAEKYIDDLPSRRTLNRYIKDGVLPSYEYKEYLGQNGLNVLYSDELVPSIIAAVELKGKMTLSEIARARQGKGEFVDIYQQKLEEIKSAIK